MSFYLKAFLRAYILPKSLNEDRARVEFILNILLSTGVILTFVPFVFNICRWVLHLKTSVMSGTAFANFLYFLGLYLLARRGYLRTVSILLVTTFFLLANLMALRWGVDLNMALLADVLAIVVGGILMDARKAFLMALLVAVSLYVIGALQSKGFIAVDRSWRTAELWTLGEVTIFSLVFFMIATVSWLSNREIAKSLKRARTSEEELKNERDSLELKVEVRTQELRELQAEKIAQLYRFAEFGRLSAGIFHDLISPLSALSLSVEQSVSLGERDGISSKEAKESLGRAVRAARKMEDLVVSVRKQLAREQTKAKFSLCEEIELVIDMLSYRARQERVNIVFSSDENIFLYGDPVKFNQVLLNLITNAIDAYAELKLGSGSLNSSTNVLREVRVNLEKKQDRVLLSITDQGAGIPAELLSKIFEVFFTTKTDGHGIGLSMTKRIVEKDFSGSIEVKSRVGVGTSFHVSLPVFEAEFTKV